MTPFLLYIGRSSLYLALFYAFFLLVMRRTTFFRLNRILLLAGTVACFLLPVLRLRTVEVPFLMVGPLTEAASEPALTAGPSAASPVPYLELLYILGFLAVLGWTAVAMVRMYRTIRKGAATRLKDGTRLVLTEADIPSFSWGRTIVMSRKDAEQNPVIRLCLRRSRWSIGSTPSSGSPSANSSSCTSTRPMTPFSTMASMLPNINFFWCGKPSGTSASPWRTASSTPNSKTEST